MTRDSFIEDARPEAASESDELRLDLEGYEGPIDALLQLAREQKVDITRISILALAEQYLEFVQRARKLRLEIAADYLVMAAWLAYLKSRLLLPAPADDGEPSGAEMAAALKFHLQRLEAMQSAGKALWQRPRLGSERFARGAPEPVKVVNTPVYELSLYDLLRAYGRNKLRAEVTRLHITLPELYSVEDAIQRLSGVIGQMPTWRKFLAFLPEDLRGGLIWRSAIATTFSASLELCREGKIEIRQDGLFGEIYLRDPSPQDSKTI